MSYGTNKLVGSGSKYALPVGIVGGFVLAGAMFAGFGGVHAASMGAAAPVPDESVMALTNLDHAMEAVTARVTPAVVNVMVTSKGNDEEQAQNGSGGGQNPFEGLPPGFQQFFGFGGGGQRQMQPQQPQLEHGVGSGVIISPDGYIITAAHVVTGAVTVKVTLEDRRIMNARVVGSDPTTDVAVLKVSATDLPAIAWGDSTRLEMGQTVLAFGSPFGYLRNSVTRGIVSGVNRSDPDNTDARKPASFIQTDAAINPGNSGGPLVNAHGELVGINTMIITNSGQFAGAGFAVPSQIVRAISTQLIKSGKVEHGYLGISMNDVTPDNAHFFNLKDATGAIVAQVTPNSPASRGGLQQGDVIDSLNGQKILNASALQVVVSEMAPGTPLELGILRNGAPQTVRLTVGQFHAESQVADSDDGDGSGGGAANNGKLGIAVETLTPQLKQQINAPDSLNGVVVENVRPGSPAEDAGLQQGDVILQVNRQPAASANQFVSEVHGSQPGQDLLLLVWSKGNASYRTIHADSTNG